MAMNKKQIQHSFAVAQLARNGKSIMIELKEVARQMKAMHRRYDVSEYSRAVAVERLRTLKTMNKKHFLKEGMAERQKEMVILRNLLANLNSGTTRRQAHSRLYSQRRHLKRRLNQFYDDCSALNINPDVLLETLSKPTP